MTCQLSRKYLVLHKKNYSLNLNVFLIKRVLESKPESNPREGCQKFTGLKFPEELWQCSHLPFRYGALWT